MSSAATSGGGKKPPGDGGNGGKKAPDPAPNQDESKAATLKMMMAIKAQKEREYAQKVREMQRLTAEKNALFKLLQDKQRSNDGKGPEQ